MDLKKKLLEEIKENDLLLLLKNSKEKEAFYGRVLDRYTPYSLSEENFNGKIITLDPALYLMPPELVAPGVYIPKVLFIETKMLKVDPSNWEIYLNEKIPPACDNSWLKNTYGPLIKAGVDFEIKRAIKQNQMELNLT